ncbi:hypothetical protein PGT21_029850 [Puccinia graminis f. sp. tritici]|uniref:Uncharacterized protein n=1 Tax=Puccinia graminis f. sp. tritici TaxID=56615 RepID=A0A5B0QUB2_PUCGR|nr:hypothetical protein PGT21_029850 [Puccinia graminis f. sp. tritici]KAA1116862.1 hypothetical protein PGTUg99_027304 [Puccinia graminis f. sp. tritici]
MEVSQSLAPKTTAPEAKASAPSEENKSQAKAATDPALTEVANKPSASNDESKALQQPDWTSAIAVIDQLYDGHQSWVSQVPSSLLAELASKALRNQTEVHELLTVLGYRIAEDRDVPVSCQLLNGAVQASLSFGNIIVCGKLVNYAICFSTEIARVEIKKQSCTSSHSANLPTSSKRPPDSWRYGCSGRSSTSTGLRYLKLSGPPHFPDRCGVAHRQRCMFDC